MMSTNRRPHTLTMRPKSIVEGIQGWIGGNPWDVVPLHGIARAYVALLGAASLLMSVALAIDDGTIVAAEGWEYGTPAALAVGGCAAIWWAFHPRSRISYALAGSILAGTFVLRGIMAAVTLVVGTPFPWAVVVAGCLCWIAGFGVLVIWRHLAPVITPKHPPDSPATYG